MFLVQRRAVWALGLSALSACATSTSSGGPLGSDQAGASADGGAGGSAGHSGSSTFNAGGISAGPGTTSGAGGSGATAGTSAAGTSSSGGSAAGSAGSSASAGSGGSGGSVAGGAGSGGTGGTSGSAGAAGSAGRGGSAGAAGSAGGAGAGSGGSAGNGGAGSCTPTTVTLIATSDSNLSAAAPSANYGIVAEAHIVRGGTSASQRALFEFDLGALPAGKTLKSAQLQLTVVNNPGQNKTLSAHRVTQSPTRAWVETEITWQAYRVGSNWTTAGGDFAAQASASQLIADAAPVGAVVSFDVLADALSFYQTPATNFGWLIKDSQEPGAATGENVYLATRDTATAEYKPKLVVGYCP